MLRAYLIEDYGSIHPEAYLSFTNITDERIYQ